MTLRSVNTTALNIFTSQENRNFAEKCASLYFESTNLRFFKLFAALLWKTMRKEKARLENANI